MIDEFFKSFIDWANNDPNIDSILLVGSYARKQAKKNSDIDLVVLCIDPNLLIDNQKWIEKFGIVNSSQMEDWGAVQSFRTSYKDFKEVEFGITSTNWADIPIDNGTREVIINGAKILLDKSELLKKLSAKCGIPIYIWTATAESFFL